MLYNFRSLLVRFRKFFATIGVILKTTNGGTIWTSQVFSNSDILNSVYFVDNSTGLTLGVGSDGIILKTTNGGTNWTIQVSGKSNALFSVYFVDNNTGWVVGNYGTILKTTIGSEPIGIWSISSEVPTGYSLNQNYSNPFNPVTNLGFGVCITEDI